MAESPAIETGRLLITPFRKEHLTMRYVGWLNDPEVVRHSNQRLRVHTIESCRDYWQSFAGTPNYFWALTAKDPSLGHIGNMNAYVDKADSVADIGIMIGEKAARGRGYAKEAWLAVCGWLFEDLGIRKITAGTLSVNEPMMALARSAGMAEDGRRLRQCIFEGREADIVYFAFFAEDWLKRKRV